MIERAMVLFVFFFLISGGNILRGGDICKGMSSDSLALVYLAVQESKLEKVK